MLREECSKQLSKVAACIIDSQSVFSLPFHLEPIAKLQVRQFDCFLKIVHHPFYIIQLRVSAHVLYHLWSCHIFIFLSLFSCLGSTNFHVGLPDISAIMPVEVICTFYALFFH